MKIWDEIFAQQTPVWSESDDEISYLIEKLFRYNIKSNYELDRKGGRQTIYLSKKNPLDFVATNDVPSGSTLRKTELKIIDGHELRGSIHSDITEQPLRDCFFDAVVALGVLLYNTRPNIQRSIIDINRIMKKGGIFFLLLFNRLTRICHMMRIIIYLVILMETEHLSSLEQITWQ